MASDKKTSRSEDEWERRVLCSDESCIGVIGPDGRCKECGLRYQGELPWEVGEGGTADREDPASPTPPADEAESVADVEAEEGVTDDEWDRRVLCSDESCIGVIGPDGRCKECGKPFRQE